MSVSVFYVPSLRRSSVKRELPRDVTFLPSGLRERRAEEGMPVGVAEAGDAVFRALPLVPAQARAVLEEMLRMGEEYSPNSLLRQLTAQQRMRGRDCRAFRRDESAALERFAAGSFSDDGSAGTKTVKAPDRGGLHMRSVAERTADVREALVDCQKVLLLAEALEERDAELTALEQRFRETEARLCAALGEGDAPESCALENTASAAGADRGKSDSFTVPWRAVVDAAFPFLPGKAILFTADEDMASDLRASGMVQPFPADRADVCAAWPHDLASGLLFACLPAWRLVGRRSLPGDRPWLDRDAEVIVARPRGGWVS